MGKRRIFSKEFKLSILREVEVKPAAQVCRDHDIHPVLLNRWKQEFQENPKGAFSGLGKKYKLEALLADRERLIGQLYAENALLKKSLQRSLERRAEERSMR